MPRWVLTQGHKRVVISSYSESELEAKLGSGESYSFGEYTVKVGKIELDTGTADVVVLPSGEKICNTL